MINMVIGIHLCTRTSKKSEEVLEGLEWPIEVAWMQGCNGKGGPWSLEDFPREPTPPRSRAYAVSRSTAKGPNRRYLAELPQAHPASHGYPKTFPDSHRLKISRRCAGAPYLTSRATLRRAPSCQH